MTIRDGGAADFAELGRIQAASPGAATWPVESYGVVLSHERRSLWIAEVEGRTAGFLVFDQLPGEDAEILNLAVAPALRRRRVGAELVERLQSQTGAKVFLEVRASNAAAQAFYEQLGFRKTGERKAYYHRPVENAWTYVWDLKG